MMYFKYKINDIMHTYEILQKWRYSGIIEFKIP